MQIPRFKFVLLFFTLIFNFTAKALFVEEAAGNGVKKIGKVAYHIIKPIVKISAPAICWGENYWINSKLKEESDSNFYSSEELIEFNKKIEDCIPFKSALKKLALPCNIIFASSPEAFFLNWFYYNFVCPALGKTFAFGKKIELIKPICTHLSYMFQGERGGAEEEKLGSEIAVWFFLNKCWQNPLTLLDEDKKTKKAPIDNIFAEAKSLWRQSGSLKNKMYKQILLSFNSFFPIFYILFCYSRFYHPTFQFLKNISGLSHAYRYVEWVHNRPNWLKNELSTLKNIKISGKFIFFCVMLYFMRPGKVLKKN